MNSRRSESAAEDALANLGPGNGPHLTTLDFGKSPFCLIDPCSLHFLWWVSDAVEQTLRELCAVVFRELESFLKEA